jgi:hypothetical protein
MNVYVSGMLFGVTTFSAILITGIAFSNKSYNHKGDLVLAVTWIVTILLGWLFFYLKNEAEQLQERRLKELGRLELKDMFDDDKFAQWHAKHNAITAELDLGTKSLTDTEVDQVACQVFLPPLKSAIGSKQMSLDDFSKTDAINLLNGKGPEQKQ